MDGCSWLVTSTPDEDDPARVVFCSVASENEAHAVIDAMVLAGGYTRTGLAPFSVPAVSPGRDLDLVNVWTMTQLVERAGVLAEPLTTLRQVPRFLARSVDELRVEPNHGALLVTAVGTDHDRVAEQLAGAAETARAATTRGRRR